MRTDNGFNNHLTGWINGDFDYSNTAVNFDDYVLIDLAFNTQSGTRSGGGGNHLIELGQMWHFHLDGYMDYFIAAMEKYGYHYTYLDFYPDGRIPPPTSVPEPSGALLAACAVAAMNVVRRRRRLHLCCERRPSLQVSRFEVSDSTTSHPHAR